MALLSSLEIVQQLEQLLTSDQKSSNPRDTERRACELAHKLWLQLEEPGALIDRIAFQPEETVALKVALDLGVYQYLSQRDSPATTSEIASHTKTDPVLMARLLRNMAGFGHIHEVDVDTFESNKFSRAFTTPKGISFGVFCTDFALRAWNAIPAFLESVQYQNPTDPMKTAVQHAFNSDKHFFQLLVETGTLETFQTCMSYYREGRAEFLDIYPAEDRLICGFDPSQGSDGVLLVDVGGGHGHDVQKFVAKFPDTQGRKVLQDQAEVISQVPKSDTMEVTVHDFFTPQPVKGARAYYMRMILHDWPDDQCLVILKNVAAAMKSGYSRLLINDIVLPDKGAARFATQSDINMLALLAAMERSEAQWRQLLEQAGLKIMKIWQGNPESVIEAEVVG